VDAFILCFVRHRGIDGPVAPLVLSLAATAHGRLDLDHPALNPDLL
jgi:hypothetical protein